jgi:hypothetical protein
VKVSLLIPAFNEAATIDERLERTASIRLVAQPTVDEEGSPDGTREVAQRAGAIVLSQKAGMRGQSAWRSLTTTETFPWSQDARTVREPAEVPGPIKLFVHAPPRSSAAPACAGQHLGRPLLHNQVKKPVSLAARETCSTTFCSRTWRSEQGTPTRRTAHARAAQEQVSAPAQPKAERGKKIAWREGSARSGCSRITR